MRDLEPPGGQTSALLVRVGRVLHFDAQTLALKIARLQGRQQRQIAGGVEDIDAQIDHANSIARQAATLRPSVGTVRPLPLC
jgi:hypothetical protein